MDRAFVDGVAACDQIDNATDVPADITDMADRKTVLQEPANKFVLPQSYDLEIFRVIFFEVTFGARGWAIQLSLELPLNLNANKKTLIRFKH